MSLCFQLYIYYTWIFQVKNICVAFVSWIKRYMENPKHSVNYGKCTILNESTSEAQSIIQGTSKESVFNGTSNRIFGDGELSVYSGIGVRFLWGAGQRAGMEKCRIALKIQAGSHLSAYYIWRRQLCPEPISKTSSFKNKKFILQFCLFKQNISFYSIYLQIKNVFIKV